MGQNQLWPRGGCWCDLRHLNLYDPVTAASISNSAFNFWKATRCPTSNHRQEWHICSELFLTCKQSDKPPCCARTKSTAFLESSWLNIWSFLLQNWIMGEKKKHRFSTFEPYELGKIARQDSSSLWITELTVLQWGLKFSFHRIHLPLEARLGSGLLFWPPVWIRN